MLTKILVVLVVIVAALLVFAPQTEADDCFFKACVPLVTDCGWLKSCKDFCCQIDLGKK
ncbi:hypothetical protein AAVH_16449 [Aphelenchoides avenae]|nr:hypothetical protein AAVH_16449 [Aphelenchus avenae]